MRPLLPISYSFLFFFFNDTATTEIYTLSLHDALPILLKRSWKGVFTTPGAMQLTRMLRGANSLARLDRKSTRLNSSHLGISYAVFCLKKKIKTREMTARYLDMTV